MGSVLFYADGEVYGHAEANNRFSQFCEKRLERIASNMQLTNDVLTFRIFYNFTFTVHDMLVPVFQTVTCNTSIKQKCVCVSVCVSVCVKDIMKNVENNANKLIYLTNTHTHTHTHIYIYIYIYIYTHTYRVFQEE